jgi:hypothetical protein
MKEPMLKPCIAWMEKLASIHPDDLSSPERIELEAHIEKCSVCATVHAEYRLMDTLIRDFPACESLLSLSTPPLKLCEKQHYYPDCPET